MCLQIGALWGRWRWLCGLDRGGATQAAVARELYPAVVARAGRRLRGAVIALHCMACIYAEHGCICRAYYALCKHIMHCSA